MNEQKKELAEWLEGATCVDELSRIDEINGDEYLDLIYSKNEKLFCVSYKNGLLYSDCPVEVVRDVERKVVQVRVRTTNYVSVEDDVVITSKEETKTLPKVL